MGLSLPFRPAASMPLLMRIVGHDSNVVTLHQNCQFITSERDLGQTAHANISSNVSLVPK
jgi:hypothetical protein